MWSSKAHADTRDLDAAAAKIRVRVRDRVAGNPELTSLSESSAPFELDNTDEPPRLVITTAALANPTPATPVVPSLAGNILVEYRLTDSEGAKCTLETEFRVASGTWTPANLGDSKVLKLDSSPTGIASSVSWNAVATFGYALVSNVELRMRANDGVQDGEWCESGVFSVDSRTLEPNAAPSVTFDGGVARVVSSSIPIKLLLVDEDSDPISLTVRWGRGSSGGPPAAGAFVAAQNVTFPAQMQGSPAGTPVTIQWTAATDLASTLFQDYLYLRIKPDDGKQQGSERLSPAFAFGNSAPTINSVVVDTDAGKATGNVVFRLNVTDSSFDPTDLEAFEFSKTGDFNTHSLSITVDTTNFPVGPLTGAVTSPTSAEQRYVWNTKAHADTKDLDAPAAKIRVKVRDRVAGALQLPSLLVPSATFELDNTDEPPSAVITTAALVNPSPGTPTVPSGAGNILIEYTLSDSEAAKCTLETEYRVAGGAWTPANLGDSKVVKVDSSPTGIATSVSWNALAAFGYDLVSDVELRMRANDGVQDGPWDVSGVFSVDSRSLQGAVKPSVSFDGAIDRVPSSPVPVKLFLVDENDDLLTLSVRYGIGTSGGPPADSDFLTTANVDFPTGMTGSAAGTPVTISWRASDDLGNTTFRDYLYLKIKPNDVGQYGTERLSPAFSFGNKAPFISAVTVNPGGSSKVSGNVVFSVSVSDNASDPTDLAIFQFSKTGNFSSHALTIPITAVNFPVGPRGGGVTSPGGEEQRYVWNSKAHADTLDLDASGARIGVRLKDRVNGVLGLSSGTVQSAATFQLDNGNTKPVVTFLGTEAAAAGRKVFRFRLTDADGDGLSVIPRFSTGGDYAAAEGTFYKAWPGSPTTEVQPFGMSAGAGTTYWFEWNTVSQTQIHYRDEPTVTFQLIATDGAAESAPAVYPSSGSMHIDNRPLEPGAPVAQITAIDTGSGSRNLTTVKIVYRLSDLNGGPGGQTVKVDVAYSTDHDPNLADPDNGHWEVARYKSGTGTSGLSAPPGGQTHEFVWNAVEDAKDATKQGLSTATIDTDGDGQADDGTIVAPAEKVYVRITPTDSGGKKGVAVVSSSFPLGNKAPVLTVLQRTALLGIGEHLLALGAV
ncbi:hypothetical protein ACFL59_12730, partial [Planctomycetota bacterium]